MKRLLCVWLPNWPIQRLHHLSARGDSPEPKASAGARPPTIVWKDDPRRGRLVVACCRASAAMGVRVAMPIAQAGEMIRVDENRSAHDRQSMCIEPHDPWIDHESLQQVAALFQQHISPQVAIETLDDHPWARFGDSANANACGLHQPESLLCEITGIAHLFEGEVGLLQAAQRLLSNWGLTARMAIADSVGAAWALAHYAGRQHDSFVPFDGPVTRSGGWIAPRGKSQPAVVSLPVESLRIVQSTVDTLHRLGIQRIDQLLGLPKSGLASRLGKQLLRRIEQATAQSDEPLVVHRPMADHAYRSELEYPTTDLEILSCRIERLMHQTTVGLATENRGALRLACRLVLANHPPLTCDIGLFAPTLDVDHLTGLVINQVESKRFPSCVVRLEVSVTLSGPLRSNQTSLFKNEPNDRGVDWMNASDIGRLLNSLSGRLGRQAVLGVTLQHDPLPEDAYRVWPLTGGRNETRTPFTTRSRGKTTRSRSKTTRSRGKKAPSPTTSPRSRDSSRPYSPHRFEQPRADREPSPEDAMRRPLSLLVRPLPLIPEKDAALYDHRLPDRFRLDGMIHKIIRYWGPERIETGWWKGPSIRRDYYRIETDQGSWWWIFRSLAPESQAPDPQNSSNQKACRWMLHGRFH